jgi:hypothetical protein
VAIVRYVAQAALADIDLPSAISLGIVLTPPPFAFLGLDAADWEALGQMLLGIGAIAAGWWTIFNYRRTRRHEAATWLQGVYKDFYLSDTFTSIRQVLEYHYVETAGPLLSRRILDREIPTTDSEEVLLRELDTLGGHPPGRRAAAVGVAVFARVGRGWHDRWCAAALCALDAVVLIPGAVGASRIMLAKLRGNPSQAPHMPVVLSTAYRQPGANCQLDPKERRLPCQLACSDVLSVVLGPVRFP